MTDVNTDNIDTFSEGVSTFINTFNLLQNDTFLIIVGVLAVMILFAGVGIGLSVLIKKAIGG